VCVIEVFCSDYLPETHGTVGTNPTPPALDQPPGETRQLRPKRLVAVSVDQGPSGPRPRAKRPRPGCRELIASNASLLKAFENLAFPASAVVAGRWPWISSSKSTDRIGGWKVDAFGSRETGPPPHRDSPGPPRVRRKRNSGSKSAAQVAGGADRPTRRCFLLALMEHGKTAPRPRQSRCRSPA